MEITQHFRFQEDKQGWACAPKRNCEKDFTPIYLLKRKELLVLHFHHSSRDVVVPEALPELDPSEGVAVPSWVGLPPIES
jgi:hypothetical protein